MSFESQMQDLKLTIRAITETASNKFQAIKLLRNAHPGHLSLTEAKAMVELAWPLGFGNGEILMSLDQDN